MLERKLEEVAERGQSALLVPGRVPDAELSSRGGQRVREDERALLWEPERRLVAAAAVVERDEPTGKLALRLESLELREAREIGRASCRERVYSNV